MTIRERMRNRIGIRKEQQEDGCLWLLFPEKDMLLFGPLVLPPITNIEGLEEERVILVYTIAGLSMMTLLTTFFKNAFIISREVGIRELKVFTNAKMEAK